MDYARKAGIVLIGAVLLLYIVGSLRMIYALATGHGNGQPVWSIVGGFYLRFMLMAFLSLMIFVLARKREGTKK